MGFRKLRTTLILIMSHSATNHEKLPSLAAMKHCSLEAIAEHLCVFTHALSDMHLLFLPQVLKQHEVHLGHSVG